MTYSIDCKNTKANREQLTALCSNFNDLYSSIGINIKVINEGDSIIAMISGSESKAKQSIKRNAGRHKAYTQYKCQYIADLQSKGLSADEIAEQLQLSRATYFRHLKRMSEHKDMNRYF